MAVNLKKSLILSIFIFITFPVVSGAVPALVNFQGQIEGPSGAVDDTLTLTFRVFNVDENGTPLWEEEQRG